jgi:hypothetical protein
MEKSKTFTQMLEHNEHEGETWSFWLQVDGNESVLGELVDLIEAEGEEDVYEFTDVTIYEWELDILMSYGNFGYGYMNQHHKVAGIITIDNDFEINDIHKGKISDFFEEEN